MNVTIYQNLLEFWNRSPATIAVETSILLLIGLIAIGGNLLVVISIYRNPSLRTITNYFVLSLSVTDILYPVLGLTLTIAWSIKSRFAFGHNMCFMQALISISLNLISAATIVLMAVNRYVCVCKPQYYKKIYNIKTCLIMIGSVWIATFTLPILLVAKSFWVVEFIPEKILCGYFYNNKDIVVSVTTNTILSIALVIPVVIIIYCYYKVFQKIRQHKKNIAPASNPSSLRTSVQEIRVTWTMFAVLVGYCLAWSPALLFILATNLTNVNVPRQYHLVVTYTVACGSAINPVIYGLLNTAFRREFLKILTCK
ncbi:muscarinic acetylcholine receptor M3-like [Actinia tenebrosa]|uniref:Muscarinic acetylcholine receptor M3-like n=1 Tax=Actinia tenebrosa TaxID=6105 RepID=A0A6P8HZD9_ACTTE|nr:muscarinic acetylcholine receptor M3-like [Actinia tenebrosa]